MFALLKIFNYIIFPPSIFIVILLMALYFIRKSPKKTAVLIIADIILLYALSIEPVKNLILSPLENFAPPIDLKVKHNADYIVILGGGTISSSPEEDGKGSLSGDAVKRAFYGIYLAELLNLPVIYSGGKLFDSQAEGESDIALKIMMRYTSKKTKLLKDDRSRTTFENAMFVKNTFNPGRVILVTSAYHMKRSLYSFSRAGINCIAAPTDYKVDNAGYNVTSFIPKSSEMDSTYKGLKEYLGLIFYKLK